ncbi:hypothetical protein H7J73_30000 [Mycolicibacterium komossense]|uniref:Secreted protein n=1 Tax=Mycolicibacterium komossense TaxID=1779 RepID=A0ABT3CL10_9MYCO|nr:hypothetical protein [Mycolicibacterium komossense]
MAAVLLGLGVIAPVGQAAAEPVAAPDLSGYQSIPVDPYLDGAAGGGEAYFQTPDGLLCAIRPVTGVAGCDGTLPATQAGVNEIVLAADVVQRGLRATANSLFVKPSGAAAPVLPEGSKISFADFECGVGAGSITVCTKGDRAQQWMVISPGHTGIGPATEGLPPGFPDPNEFVTGDDSYLVGVGAKNIFPVFTVGDGLTCSMVLFSGGEMGCDGKLPGVRAGENEVYAQLPGPVGMRRTDIPKYSTPAYPGHIRQLPVGYRINSNGGTCMATEGGVACYGSLAGKVQGFQVTPKATTTFGGS